VLTALVPRDSRLKTSARKEPTANQSLPDLRETELAVHLKTPSSVSYSAVAATLSIGRSSYCREYWPSCGDSGYAEPLAFEPGYKVLRTEGRRGPVARWPGGAGEADGVQMPQQDVDPRRPGLDAAKDGVVVAVTALGPPSAAGRGSKIGSEWMVALVTGGSAAHVQSRRAANRARDLMSECSSARSCSDG
jgi:hypothetical protein